MDHALYRVSFTTENEDEADRVGILYATLAGFDPTAASRIWERVCGLSGGSVHGFLYDHPLHSQRVESTRSYGEAAREYWVPGSPSPDAKSILANNAVTGTTESSEGVAALLSGAAEYLSQVQRTKAEVASRRAKRAELEAGFSTESGMREGDALFSRGDTSSAARRYLQVVQANPENYIAAYGLGRCLAMLGQKDDAFGVLTAAINSGFHDHRLMRRDRALSSLRGDPRLEPLIRAAKKLD